MLVSDSCCPALSRCPAPDPIQVHVPPTGNTALRVPAGDNIMGVLKALGNYGTLILALQVCGCVWGGAVVCWWMLMHALTGWGRPDPLVCTKCTQCTASDTTCTALNLPYRHGPSD